MKMMKKALVAASVLSLVLGFAACKNTDDDPAIQVKDSGKHYWLDSTTGKNESSTDTKRVWNLTTFKHYGELVHLQIMNQTTASTDGAVGFVWDLKQSKDLNKSDDTPPADVVVDGKTLTWKDNANNFLIAGVRNNGGTIQYYVSKYFNIINKNAENFGAGSNTVTTNELGLGTKQPRELMVADFTTLPKAEIGSDGIVHVWLDIYPATSSYGLKKATPEEGATTGSYVVDFYVGSAVPSENSVLAKRVIISSEQTGYATATPGQGYLAVYANIYKGKTLVCDWYLQKDYAEAEPIED